jgi:cytochrome c oxidase assembly protein subunit 15
VRRRIDRPLAGRLAVIFVLGGLQGALGWYMVKSGLVDDPRVSQYRLTAHLGLAFLIYAAMFWVALDLLYPGDAMRGDARAQRGLRRAATGLVALVFLMVLSGGLVAGIRAGFAYNTFPLMNGHLVPPEIMMIEPWYLNFFNNMAAVQFDHRLIAWILAIAVPWFWYASRRADASDRTRTAATAFLALLVVQIALGIATLLFVVPLSLAALHQAGAVFVFSAAIHARHSLR